MSAKAGKASSAATNRPLDAHNDDTPQSAGKTSVGTHDDVNLRLAEIIDLPMTQSLMDSFYELVHIPMGIMDTKGELLVSTGWQDICAKFHRASPATHKNCLESDTHLTAGIPSGEFKLYKCKNHMWEAATPIIVEGWHFGNLLSGQFFFTDELVDYEFFRAQARKYGFDEESYLAAIKLVPRISRESINTAMSFMMKLAQMLSQIGYNNIKLARSIHDRQQAQARAAEREIEFHTLFNTIPLSTALIDSKTLEFLQFNDAAAENLGYTREEFAKLTVHDIDAFYSGEELPELVKEKSLKGDLIVLETKHRTKSGHIRDVIVYYRIMNIDGRNVSNCVWEDVTDKKIAEAALIQSEQRATERETWFRTLFETIPTSVVLIDPRSREMLQFNDAAARQLGYTREEFAKLTVDDIDAVHSPEELDEHFAKRMRSRGFAVFDRKHRTKSGEIRDIVVYSHFLTMNGRLVDNSVWYDVTEKKAAEAALLQSEKLASVGRMAATVAHEINNPLEAVTNCIYLAASNSTLPPDVKDLLTIAEQELHRVAHIAKRTLGFYRETAKPAAVDIRTLVDEVVELYNPKFKRKDIRLKIEHCGHSAGIVGIAGEIRQVISNLLMNAIDASRPKGMVRVRTRRITLHDRTYMRVTIADSGAGISKQNQSRIFEPFFTTKKEVGTGLGLWVSREIVHKHQGKLRIRSLEGKGTVFCVLFPNSQEPSI